MKKSNTQSDMMESEKNEIITFSCESSCEEEATDKDIYNENKKRGRPRKNKDDIEFNCLWKFSFKTFIACARLTQKENAVKNITYCMRLYEELWIKHLIKNYLDIDNLNKKHYLGNAQSKCDQVRTCLQTLFNQFHQELDDKSAFILKQKRDVKDLKCKCSNKLKCYNLGKHFRPFFLLCILSHGLISQIPFDLTFPYEINFFSPDDKSKRLLIPSPLLKFIFNIREVKRSMHNYVFNFGMRNLLNTVDNITIQNFYNILVHSAICEKERKKERKVELRVFFTAFYEEFKEYLEKNRINEITWISLEPQILQEGRRVAEGVVEMIEILNPNATNNELVELAAAFTVDQLENEILNDGFNINEIKGLCFNAYCGSNIILSDDFRTCKRLVEEIDKDAVVFTNRPLKLNEIFQVQIDRTIELENEKNEELDYMVIGITSFIPGNRIIPSKIKEFCAESTWLMSKNQIINNGDPTKSNYREDKILEEEDVVGLVIKKENGERNLHFLLNGTDLGIAVSAIPEKDVYGVIDVKGFTVQVSLYDDVVKEPPSKKQKSTTESSSLQQMDTSLIDSAEKLVVSEIICKNNLSSIEKININYAFALNTNETIHSIFKNETNILNELILYEHTNNGKIEVVYNNVKVINLCARNAVTNSLAWIYINNSFFKKFSFKNLENLTDFFEKIDLTKFLPLSIMHSDEKMKINVQNFTECVKINLNDPNRFTSVRINNRIIKEFKAYYDPSDMFNLNSNVLSFSYSSYFFEKKCLKCNGSYEDGNSNITISRYNYKKLNLSNSDEIRAVIEANISDYRCICGVSSEIIPYYNDLVVIILNTLENVEIGKITKFIELNSFRLMKKVKFNLIGIVGLDTPNRDEYSDITRNQALKHFVAAIPTRRLGMLRIDDLGSTLSETSIPMPESTPFCPNILFYFNENQPSIEIQEYVIELLKKRKFSEAIKAHKAHLERISPQFMEVDEEPYSPATTSLQTELENMEMPSTSASAILQKKAQRMEVDKEKTTQQKQSTEQETSKRSFKIKVLPQIKLQEVEAAEEAKLSKFQRKRIKRAKEKLEKKKKQVEEEKETLVKRIRLMRQNGKSLEEQMTVFGNSIVNILKLIRSIESTVKYIPPDMCDSAIQLEVSISEPLLDLRATSNSDFNVCANPSDSKIKEDSLRQKQLKALNLFENTMVEKTIRIPHEESMKNKDNNNDEIMLSSYGKILAEEIAARIKQENKFNKMYISAKKAKSTSSNENEQESSNESDQEDPYESDIHDVEESKEASENEEETEDDDDNDEYYDYTVDETGKPSKAYPEAQDPDNFTTFEDHELLRKVLENYYMEKFKDENITLNKAIIKDSKCIIQICPYEKHQVTSFCKLHLYIINFMRRITYGLKCRTKCCNLKGRYDSHKGLCELCLQLKPFQRVQLRYVNVATEVLSDGEIRRMIATDFQVFVIPHLREIIVYRYAGIIEYSLVLNYAGISSARFPLRIMAHDNRRTKGYFVAIRLNVFMNVENLKKYEYFLIIYLEKVFSKFNLMNRCAGGSTTKTFVSNFSSGYAYLLLYVDQNLQKANENIDFQDKSFKFFYSAKKNPRLEKMKEEMIFEKYKHKFPLFYKRPRNNQKVEHVFANFLGYFVPLPLLNEKLKCSHPICKKKDFIYANDHSLLTHISRVNHYCCVNSECVSKEIYFENRKDLISHWLVKHNFKYVCACCKRTFNSDTGRSNHFRYMKNEGICELCNKTVKCNDYVTHMKSHNRSIEHNAVPLY